MQYILTAAIIATTFFERNLAGADPWDYINIDGWPKQCQTGKQQSPVDIAKSSAASKDIPPLVLSNYKKVSAVLVNNGHTVQIKIADANNPTSLPTISGGPLDGTYTLQDIHFHWDSEHTIDGHRYPLESHFVHFKSNLTDFPSALKVKNGVAVIAVLYDVGCSNPQIKEVGLHIDKVSKNLGTKVSLPKSINLRSLLPVNIGHYFTYQGSLTAPGCHEGVTWIIFEGRLTVTQKELKQLINIYTAKDEPVKQNYRPLQDLNGREVSYTFDHTERKMDLFQNYFNRALGRTK